MEAEGEGAAVLCHAAVIEVLAALLFSPGALAEADGGAAVAVDSEAEALAALVVEVAAAAVQVEAGKKIILPGGV